MSPNIYFSLPSLDLFKLPAGASDPSTLAAPPAPISQFTLPAELYSQAYDARVPLTIAAVYAVSAITMNKVNAARGNKPWGFSKTRWFHWVVILHNVFLAVYSAWTFVGMYKALKTTIPSPSGPDGLIGVVDSLCKLHGPAGLTNSAEYNAATGQFVNTSSGLASDVSDATLTAAGRLWNEGLAFYGWFFYLSKFYEVIDTIIILAKGKKSSTLQTYHHAGAMMCMWAGMRYMTPAIWLFCFLNSGIHAMMYTYYTITAFRIRVPKAVKQTLTTMQIMQFVFGVYFAAAHSFISYDIPTSSVVETPAAHNATAPASIKSIIYRAAGAEGLAEAVGKAAANTATVQGYKTVQCINTEGQTFATWLNVFYLGPLMYLFMRFFYRSYIRRAQPAKNHNVKGQVKAVEGAVVDASKGVDRTLNGSTRSRKA